MPQMSATPINDASAIHGEGGIESTGTRVADGEQGFELEDALVMFTLNLTPPSKQRISVWY